MAIQQPYIRAVGLEESLDGNARGKSIFSAAEEAEFKQFAAQPNVIQELRNRIAPAIFGVDDVKAAVACLLFGERTQCRSTARMQKQAPQGVLWEQKVICNPN